MNGYNIVCEIVITNSAKSLIKILRGLLRQKAKIKSDLKKARSLKHSKGYLWEHPELTYQRNKLDDVNTHIDRIEKAFKGKFNRGIPIAVYKL